MASRFPHALVISHGAGKSHWNAMAKMVAIPHAVVIPIKITDAREFFGLGIKRWMNDSSDSFEKHIVAMKRIW